MNIHVQSGAAPLKELTQDLTDLRSNIIAECVSDSPRVDEAHEDNQAGAENLLHYLALRRRDLCSMQHRLSELGLSSLGRAEAHVLPTIDAVLSMLHLGATNTWQPSQIIGPSDMKEGHQSLDKHTTALFGPRRQDRNGRIMVTMPATAACDYDLVQNFISQGMDCARITTRKSGHASFITSAERKKS